jgi:hypothetical protein
MDIMKKLSDLQNLDLSRLTLPGWILVLVAIAVAGSSGCTMASLSYSVAGEQADRTGRSASYSLLPAAVIFVVLLAGIFYGGSWVMKLCGIPIVRDR